MLILAEQEANNLVEVAAENWQHLFILSLKEVLNQRIQETCVPLGLAFVLRLCLHIFGIWLLKLEYRLLGLLVFEIQLINHGLFLLLFVLLKSLWFGYTDAKTLTFVSLRLSLTSLLTSSASS